MIYEPGSRYNLLILEIFVFFSGKILFLEENMMILGSLLRKEWFKEIQRIFLAVTEFFIFTRTGLHKKHVNN